MIKLLVHAHEYLIWYAGLLSPTRLEKETENDIVLRVTFQLNMAFEKSISVFDTTVNFDYV